MPTEQLTKCFIPLKLRAMFGLKNLCQPPSPQQFITDSFKAVVFFSGFLLPVFGDRVSVTFLS